MVNEKTVRINFESTGADKVIAGLNNIGKAAQKFSNEWRNIASFDTSKILRSLNNLDATKFTVQTQNLKVNLDKLAASLRKVQVISKNGLVNDVFISKNVTQIRSLGASLKTLQVQFRNIKKVMNEFRMEFLGIMFFGMQVQRTFTNIARSGVTAFTKIMDSSDMVGTNIAIVSAHFQFLQFVIGSAINRALGPLIPMITEVLLKISQWIQKNPKLTAFIVILGIAIGSLLFAVFALGLALNSIVQLFVGPLGTAIASLLGSVGFGGLLAIIGAVIAIVALLVAAWKADFGGIQDFVKETLGIVWKTFKTVFRDIWALIKTVFGIIVAVFEGDWDKVIELTKNAGILIVRILTKALAGVGAALFNVGAFIVNVIYDLLFNVLINGFIKFAEIVFGIFIKVGDFIAKAVSKPLDMVINAINAVVAKIPGLSNLKLPSVSSMLRNDGDELINKSKQFSKNMRDSVSGFADFLKADYITADQVASAFEVIDTKLPVSSPDSGKEVAPAPQPAPVTINSVNITADSDSTFQKIVDEIRRFPA